MRSQEVASLARLIADARRVVAFTGAGISTQSGIPDFRGPQGLWTKVDPRDFTLSTYVRDAEVRKRIWRTRLERSSIDYQPNDGHRALVDMERMGILDCVITQNVDGLHQKAGSSTVFELHGSPATVWCLSCTRRWPSQHALERLNAGEDDPHCLDCGGILKSGTILFEEMLPQDVVDEALMRAEAADLVLAVGSSLQVYPAAGIPIAAVRSGARLVIVNAEPTPLDDIAALVIQAEAGAVLREAVASARVERSSNHS